MKMSLLLKDIKNQYEKTYKLPAFDNEGKGNMRFMEALAMSNDKHKRNFIESDITFINSLVTIHDELEK